jgi:hypothetical protein
MFCVNDIFENEFDKEAFRRFLQNEIVDQQYYFAAVFAEQVGQFGKPLFDSP